MDHGRRPAPCQPNRHRNPSSPSNYAGAEGAVIKSCAWLHSASVAEGRADSGHQVESAQPSGGHSPLNDGGDAVTVARRAWLKRLLNGLGAGFIVNYRLSPTQAGEEAPASR